MPEVFVFFGRETAGITVDFEPANVPLPGEMPVDRDHTAPNAIVPTPMLHLVVVVLGMGHVLIHRKLGVPGELRAVVFHRTGRFAAGPLAIRRIDHVRVVVV